MSVFQLGIIIKERREELGISQEILADGICAVPNLSRIENGERIPTKTHFEMLMQRLGYSAVSLDFFTDRQDFQAYELKFKIRQAYMEKDYNLARAYVEELETLLPNPTNVDKQFLCQISKIKEYQDKEKKFVSKIFYLFAVQIKKERRKKMEAVAIVAITVVAIVSLCKKKDWNVLLHA